MSHMVDVVPDGRLPEDVDWTMVETGAGDVMFFVKQSCAGCADVLAEAWAAYRRFEERNRDLADAIVESMSGGGGMGSV